MKKKYFLLFLLSFIIFFILNKLFFFDKKIKNNFSKNNYNIEIFSKKDIWIYKNYGFFNKKVDNLDYLNKKNNWIIFSSDWKIITNRHFLEKNNKYFWIINNKKYDLKVLKIFKNRDLAILKIMDFNKKIEKINFLKNKNNLKIWEKIYFKKNDKKFFSKILEKNLKQTYYEKFQKKFLLDLIKTNFKIKKWDSWRGVFNEKWKLIWIISFKKNNFSYITIFDKNIFLEFKEK